MKTKFLAYTAALLLALGLVASPTSAQVGASTVAFENFLKGESVSVGIGADNSDVALIVKYIGTQASGTVNVTGNNAILMKSGASGSEVADTSIQCGATAGTLDITQASCDTLGEIVDIINATTTWRAIILDGLRTDVANANISNLSATPAALVNGVNILFKTSTALTSTIALTPYRTMAPYLVQQAVRSTTFPGPQVALKNPLDGQRAIFYIANATTTFGGGTSTFTVYSVLAKESGGFTIGPTGAGSEVVTTLYSVAAGATTVNKVFDFSNWGLWARKNEKLIIRVTNSSAMSSTSFYGYGYSFLYR